MFWSLSLILGWVFACMIVIGLAIEDRIKKN